MDKNHPNYVATYEPVKHGFKFDFRLEHLTVRDVVIVTCPACNHQYKVAPHVFLSRYRELAKMVDIAKHDMDCKHCPSKGHMEWKILRATGPDFKTSD